MLEIVTVGVAIAFAVMAGVFFSFSSFVMTALGNLNPSDGIKAMQRINIDVFCWSFTLLFFGNPLASLALGIFAVWQWSQPGSVYYLIGSMVYLIGCLGVTGAANVPLNNALARTNPSDATAKCQWHDYLYRWTRWNHVRTAACLIASFMIFIAIYANTN